MKTALSISVLALTAILVAPAAFAEGDYYSGGDDYHGGDSGHVDMFDPAKYDIHTGDLSGYSLGVTIDTLAKSKAIGDAGAATLNGGETFSFVDLSQEGVLFGNVTPDGVDWQVSSLGTQSLAAGALDEGSYTSAATAEISSKAADWRGVKISVGSSQ